MHDLRRLDGLLGTLCDEPVEQTCVNQCSGHGECRLGFCKCHPGWYGTDCGLRRAGKDDEEGAWPARGERRRGIVGAAGRCRARVRGCMTEWGPGA